MKHKQVSHVTHPPTTESKHVELFCSVDPNDQKKTACYDIDVEVDDTLKTQMNSFLLSTASQQEIAGLDNKVQIAAQRTPAGFLFFLSRGVSDRHIPCLCDERELFFLFPAACLCFLSVGGFDLSNYQILPDCRVTCLTNVFLVK